MGINVQSLLAQARALSPDGQITMAQLEELASRQPVAPRSTGLALPEGFIDRSTLPESFRTTAQGNTLTRSYTQIPLDPILEELEGIGWQAYAGKGAMNMVRGRNARGLASGRSTETGKHAVTLRNPEMTKAGIQRGDRFVQATLINAHDGSSPLIFMLGILELVCTNGMTSMRSGFSIRLRHVGLTLDVITSKFLELASNANTMLEQARIMSGIMLSNEQANEFARRAIPLRWALEVENDRHQFVPNESIPSPSLLLQSLYNAQSETTLWNVAQNVERNLLDGGFNIPGSTKSGQRKVTSVKGLDALTRINAGVDALAWEFSQELGADLPMPTPVIEPTYTVLS